VVTADDVVRSLTMLASVGLLAAPFRMTAPFRRLCIATMGFRDVRLCEENMLRLQCVVVDVLQTLGEAIVYDPVFCALLHATLSRVRAWLDCLQSSTAEYSAAKSIVYMQHPEQEVLCTVRLMFDVMILTPVLDARYAPHHLDFRRRLQWALTHAFPLVFFDPDVYPVKDLWDPAAVKSAESQFIERTSPKSTCTFDTIDLDLDKYDHFWVAEDPRAV
jgi:hypothetical protein